MITATLIALIWHGAALDTDATLLFQTSMRAPSDAQYCRAMSDKPQVAKQQMSDENGERAPSEDVSVLCTFRTVIWNKSFGVDVSEMAEGWFAREQAGWNETICRDPAQSALSRRGWRFVQNITFRGGNSFTMDASCVSRP